MEIKRIDSSSLSIFFKYQLAAYFFLDMLYLVHERHANVPTFFTIIIWKWRHDSSKLR